MNFRLVGPHECTSKGDTLPLRTCHHTVIVRTIKRTYCTAMNAPRPLIDRGTPRARVRHTHPFLLASTTWNQAPEHPGACRCLAVVNAQYGHLLRVERPSVVLQDGPDRECSLHRHFRRRSHCICRNFERLRWLRDATLQVHSDAHPRR